MATRVDDHSMLCTATFVVHVVKIVFSHSAVEPIVSLLLLHLAVILLLLDE